MARTLTFDYISFDNAGNQKAFLGYLSWHQNAADGGGGALTSSLMANAVFTALECFGAKAADMLPFACFWLPKVNGDSPPRLCHGFRRVAVK